MELYEEGLPVLVTYSAQMVSQHIILSRLDPWDAAPAVGTVGRDLILRTRDGDEELLMV